MWCHTCHRGRPRPLTLEEELAEVYAAEGIEPTIARYRSLRERFLFRGSYDFGEASLNALGYSLIEEHPHDAVAIFALNAEQFPQSGNAWDSLAEGYLKTGDRARAVENYRKSLELAPDNDNAREKLRELGADG
jgi:tetratricopeptide (TPR) repeat protein